MVSFLGFDDEQLVGSVRGEDQRGILAGGAVLDPDADGGDGTVGRRSIQHEGGDDPAHVDADGERPVPGLYDGCVRVGEKDEDPGQLAAAQVPGMGEHLRG